MARRLFINAMWFAFSYFDQYQQDVCPLETRPRRPPHFRPRAEDALSNELDQMDAHPLILAIGAQATRKHALESTSYAPQIILLLDPCRPRG